MAGAPLVEHAIRVARGAESVARVVVSTDGPAIATAVQADGTEVVRRPGLWDPRGRVDVSAFSGVFKHRHKYIMQGLSDA